jgi:hypothetical protein
LVSIKEAWTDDGERIKDRFEDPRLFTFIPKLDDGSAHRASIEVPVEDIAKIFDPFEPQVTKYDVSIATGRAHIEVEWDNIEHLPKVVLNGKWIPPVVPGFNKTP